MQQAECAIKEWKCRLFAEENAIIFQFFLGGDESRNLIAKCFKTIKEKNLFRSILYDRVCERNGKRSWKIYCSERWGASSDEIDAMISEIGGLEK